MTRTHRISFLEINSDEVTIMDSVPEDRFVVFVREEHGWTDSPETVEQEVGSCASYEEACLVRREYHAFARSCVIRYVGPAGGGD